MKTLSNDELNEMFGNYLHEMRKQRGLTQERLAEGICDPRQIYRYEKGYSLPSAQKLFYMSERLGVDLMNFFEQFEVHNYKILTKLKQEIETCFYKNDFQTPLELIKDFEEKLEYLTNKNTQYYLWVQSSCLYRTGSKYEKVIEKIDLALSKTYIEGVKTLTLQEINLLNLKAVILMENNHIDEALSLWNLILDKIDFNINQELNKILPKIYYNLSYIHIKNKQYSKAIKTSQRGIDYCINHGSLLGLAYLYYNNGVANLYAKNKHSGIKSIIKTFHLLEIENNSIIITRFKEGLKKDFNLKIDDYM